MIPSSLITSRKKLVELRGYAVCDILLRSYLYSSGHGDTVVSSRHISYLDIYHNIIAVRVYIITKIYYKQSEALLYILRCTYVCKNRKKVYMGMVFVFNLVCVSVP